MKHFIALLIIISPFIAKGQRFDIDRFLIEAEYANANFQNLKVSKRIFYFECQTKKDALLIASLICLNSNRSRNCFNILIGDEKVVLIESDLKRFAFNLSSKKVHLN